MKTAMTGLAIAATMTVLAALPAAAEVTYSGTASGSGGRSVSASGSAGYDPATGRTHTTTYTNGQGQSATRSTTAKCAATGGKSLDCTKTSTTGKRSRTVGRSIDAEGVGTAVTRQGPNGGGTRQSTITR